jgi:hypothetical protein
LRSINELVWRNARDDHRFRREAERRPRIHVQPCARVRQPRLEIAGDELAETKRIVFEALKTHPKINEIAFAHAVR